MPKNLTDVSQFNTVAVPIGTDSATASSVETTFQILTDRTRYLLNLAFGYLSAAYLNYHEADTTSLAVITGSAVMAGCKTTYSNEERIHTIIDDDGMTAICYHPGKAGSSAPGGGGVYWKDESTTPGTALSWTASATAVDICAAWQGTNVDRLAVSNSATGQVGRYSGAGWASVSGGVSGTTWTACEYGYDGSDRWVIGGNSGAISTSPNPTSTSFVARSSGLTGNIVRIRSNRKPNSNHQFLALDSSGNVSISNSTGITWTATLVASLGLTSTLESIAWDAKNDRWVGIQYNGYRAWSTDGISWTESSADEMPDYTPAAGNKFFLDADDQGNLVLGVHSSGNRAFIYVAGNGGDDMPNGRPWEEAFFPGMYTSAKILFMGWGRVITAGASGVFYSDQTHTTRGEGS